MRKFHDFRIKANINLEYMFQNILIVSKVPEEEQTSSQPITKGGKKFDTVAHFHTQISMSLCPRGKSTELYTGRNLINETRSIKKRETGKTGDNKRGLEGMYSWLSVAFIYFLASRLEMVGGS